MSSSSPRTASTSIRTTATKYSYKRVDNNSNNGEDEEEIELTTTATTTTTNHDGVCVIDHDDDNENERDGLFRRDDDDDDDGDVDTSNSNERQRRKQRQDQELQPLELTNEEEEEEYYVNNNYYEDSFGFIPTTIRTILRRYCCCYCWRWWNNNNDKRLLLALLHLSSICITLVVQIPMMVVHCATYTIYYQWIGRLWIILPILVHSSLALSSSHLQLLRCKMMMNSNNHISNSSSNSKNKESGYFVTVWTSLSSLLDIITFLVVYPTIWNAIIDSLFTEINGTIVLEYTNDYYALRTYSIIGILIASSRLCVGSLTIITRRRRATVISTAKEEEDNEEETEAKGGGNGKEELEEFQQQHPPTTTSIVSETTTRQRREQKRRRKQRRRTYEILMMLIKILNIKIYIYWFVLVPLLVVCILSVIGTFFTKLPRTSTATTTSSTASNGCNTMDLTECWLPFPSFGSHMIRNVSTETGWKVNLNGENLPPMRSMNDYIHPTTMDMTFLNEELDGFSTMGPILFYLDGLKEADMEEEEHNNKQLHGHNVAVSITSQSKTLLLNVNTSTLVAHSSEIDYLDLNNPMVMVFPAQPLQHNQHYALAVINATNKMGMPLTPTTGLTTTMLLQLSTTNKGTPNSVDDNGERFDRFTQYVLPSLSKAAPWLSFPSSSSSSSEFTTSSSSSSFPDGIQLLFDFVTVSEASQLGPVRAVRDATMNHISSSQYNWKEHVRVNSIEEGHCDDSSEYATTARTIHAEIDVPWFLRGYGPGQRGAVLDTKALRAGNPTTMGAAKFIVHVPCSIRAAAIYNSAGNDDTNSDEANINNNEKKGKPIRAIMEFGHGLFANRGESYVDYVQQMAHDEGYIIMAMDWRGMSSFDLLVVVRTLLGQPSLFQSIRDNLIQGFANKFALQHFSQNGMLSMDWFEFTPTTSIKTTGTGGSGRKRAMIAPTLNDEPPVNVFYGISQGGILGAGYTALSAPTGLIKRAILGVPGTPFAMIMTRSLDFSSYDLLLLLNFYNNRHVRSFLAIIQMAWDSVEGSGVLATPVREKPIPPILMQAGLGDPVVPTIAAEALARGLNASVLPNHPREIWGIPEVKAADETQSGPHTTLTELLYEKEYATLPVDDVFAKVPNSVHECVRRDRALIRQIKEFVNTGRVIDICIDDGGCHRSEAAC